VDSLTPVSRTSDQNKSSNAVFFGPSTSESESTHAAVVPVLPPYVKEWVQGYLPA